MKCDICKKETKFYIDGKTKIGKWAFMCKECHKTYGVGFGLGKGQRYFDRKLLFKEDMK
jgi:transposase-like protein